MEVEHSPQVHVSETLVCSTGQHHCGSVHQLPWRHSLTAVAQVSSEDKHVEQHQAHEPLSDTCARRFKQGCRSSVPVRRVDSPSAGGGAGLAEIQPGSRRSLHLAGKRLLSTVFSMSDVNVLLGADALANSWPCIPPSQLELPHSGQGERELLILHQSGRPSTG